MWCPRRKSGEVMYECEERIEEAFGIEFEAASATEGERETPEQASYAASEQGWEVQEARLAVAREEDNEEGDCSQNSE